MLAHSSAVDLRSRLLASFSRARAGTDWLTAPLSPEDQGVQSMPDASPAKWHRAHTTWFWETFLLAPRGVAPFDARWGALFNSYYVALGDRHARPKRGVLSRPTADEVTAYRAEVDARVRAVLAAVSEPELVALAPNCVRLRLRRPQLSRQRSGHLLGSGSLAGTQEGSVPRQR
jgi:hypothetical protein